MSPDTFAIYTNYHYTGPRDWVSGELRRLGRGKTIVLATDGLRTVSDFNHKCGINILKSDNSVVWRDNMSREVLKALPSQKGNLPDEEDRYGRIWRLLTDFE
jgi:hypothetical protein